MFKIQEAIGHVFCDKCGRMIDVDLTKHDYEIMYSMRKKPGDKDLCTHCFEKEKREHAV